MAAVNRVLEASGTSGDFLRLPIGQDVDQLTNGFYLQFFYRSGDRDFLNQPNAGSPLTKNVICAHHGGSPKVGWELTIGEEIGAMIFRMDNGIDSEALWRIAAPPPSFTEIQFKYDHNAGSPLFRIFFDGLEFYASGNGAAQTNGLPNTTSTDITFFSSNGDNPLTVGALGGFIRFCDTYLSDADINNAHAAGRAQDFDTLSPQLPNVVSLVQIGDGPSDTTTTFYNQAGTSPENNASIVSASSPQWSGLTGYRPPRHVGDRFSFSGALGSPQEWIAGASSGLTPALSVSSTNSPESAVLISGTPPGGEIYRHYVRYNRPRCGHFEMHRVVIGAVGVTEVFGLVLTPFRQAAGAEAQAVMFLINITNGIPTIHTGEYNATFSEYRNSLTDGTVAVSGGGTAMPGTAAANDEYELIFCLDHHTLTGYVRNLTQDLQFVRLQYAVTNEVQSDGLTDLMPQSGYFAAVTLLGNADLYLTEYQYVDKSIYQPELLVVSDSLMDVDQDTYTACVPGILNENFAASAKPYRSVEHFGGPGDRIEDVQACFDDGAATAIAAKNIMLEVCANTLGTTSLSTTSTELSALMGDFRALGSTELIYIPYLVPGVFGSPEVTAPTWNTEVDSIVATDGAALAIDVYNALGSPQGTNAIDPDLFDDSVHMNDAGALVYAGDVETLYESVLYTYPESMTLTGFGASTSISTTISGALEQLTISLFAAAVRADIDTNISATPEALTISTLAGVISLDVSINANTEALSITANTATVQADIDTNISANTEALSVSTFAGQVSLGINAATEQLTISTFLAAISSDTAISAAVESLQLTPAAAAVSLGTIISGDLESLTITANGSTITTEFALTGNLEQLVLSELAAQVSISTIINASLESLTITENGAVITTATGITANLESLTLSALSAVLTIPTDEISAPGLEFSIEPDRIHFTFRSA